MDVEVVGFVRIQANLWGKDLKSGDISYQCSVQIARCSGSGRINRNERCGNDFFATLSKTICTLDGLSLKAPQLQSGNFPLRIGSFLESGTICGLSEQCQFKLDAVRVGPKQPIALPATVRSTE